MTGQEKQLNIRCPFDLKEISATSYDNEDQLSPARVAKTGDTLYIVSSNNDITRKVKYQLRWNGATPHQIDFWRRGEGTDDDEPVLYKAPAFGSAFYPGNLILGGQSLYDGEADYLHDGSFFPGAGWVNLDVGETDIDYQNLCASAFDDVACVELAFLRENRRTQALTMPNWLVGVQQFINNKFKGCFDKIKEKLPSLPLEVEANIETTLEETTFLTEDEGTRYYAINRERTAGASIGFSARATMDIAAEIPWLTIGPFVEVSIAVVPAYEYAEKKLFFENEYEPLTRTFESPLTGEIALGAIIALNLHGQDTTGISLSASAWGAFPVEMKPKLRYDIGSDTYCGLLEFNAGPASLNISVGVSAQFNWGDFDIDMDIFSYSWNYPITDKYFNKLGEINFTDYGEPCR